MGLGMGEVILILVVALVIFGPRKLPELGRSLGQAMAQFRRASEDFKRTWEQEVELEKIRKGETTSSGESSYSYNEPYDSYNPYADESSGSGGSETYQSDTASSSPEASTTQKQPAAETATVGAGTTATKAQPEKQHWI
jgi:TatA/E family protein of Tat protein translocase